MSKKKDMKKPPKAEKVRTAKDVPNAAKRALKTQAENTVNHGNSGGESCN